jgi:sugar phosphate isomerase/epimerase
MEIALMAASMLEKSWEQMLDVAKSHGIRLVEACAGGHIPKVHYDPVQLSSDESKFDAFRASLHDREMQICSFGCHGNPLHPNRAIADAAHADLVATCKIAERLGVHHISLLAGTPGGGPNDKTPNWIINSAFVMWRDAYRWQWDQMIIPYWKRTAKIADDHAVKLCIEPHTGDAVYNTQTFLRLREEVGPTIGMNLDPSHLWWQGIDPIVFIETIGEAIYTCHVKDAAFDERLVARDGLVSSAYYDEWDKRSWSYRTLGYGHDDLFWRSFIIALRRIGYDGPVSIECEEPYLTVDDSLAKAVQLLHRVLPKEPAPSGNWMDAYKLDDYERNLGGQGS